MSLNKHFGFESNSDFIFRNGPKEGPDAESEKVDRFVEAREEGETKEQYGEKVLNKYDEVISRLEEVADNDLHLYSEELVVAVKASLPGIIEDRDQIQELLKGDWSEKNLGKYVEGLEHSIDGLTQLHESAWEGKDSQDMRDLLSLYETAVVSEDETDLLKTGEVHDLATDLLEHGYIDQAMILVRSDNYRGDFSLEDDSDDTKYLLEAMDKAVSEMPKLEIDEAVAFVRDLLNTGFHEAGINMILSDKYRDLFSEKDVFLMISDQGEHVTAEDFNRLKDVYFNDWDKDEDGFLVVPEDLNELENLIKIYGVINEFLNDYESSDDLPDLLDENWDGDLNKILDRMHDSGLNDLAVKLAVKAEESGFVFEGEDGRSWTGGDTSAEILALHKSGDQIPHYMERGLVKHGYDMDALESYEKLREMKDPSLIEIAKTIDELVQGGMLAAATELLLDDDIASKLEAFDVHLLLKGRMKKFSDEQAQSLIAKYFGEHVDENFENSVFDKFNDLVPETEILVEDSADQMGASFGQLVDAGLVGDRKTGDIGKEYWSRAIGMAHGMGQLNSDMVDHFRQITGANVDVVALLDSYNDAIEGKKLKSKKVVQLAGDLVDAGLVDQAVGLMVSDRYRKKFKKRDVVILVAEAGELTDFQGQEIMDVFMKGEGLSKDLAKLSTLVGNYQTLMDDIRFGAISNVDRADIDATVDGLLKEDLEERAAKLARAYYGDKVPAEMRVALGLDEKDKGA